MKKQKRISIEKRKFDWLMKYCDMCEGDADYHFKQIDKIMPTLKIGDKLYDWRNTNFEKQITYYQEFTVINIVDRKTGIIKVSPETYHDNITGFYTLKELQKFNLKYEIIK